MLPIDISRLAPTSAVAWVARSSGTKPEFALADRPTPRFLAARWHRRQARLDLPVRLDQHLLSYCERGAGLSTIILDGARRQARQHAGAVCFLPAGHPVQWRLDADVDVVHLHLYIAPEVLGVALRGRACGEPPALAMLLNVHDPWLDHFFQLLAAEYECCRGSGRLQDLDLLDRLDGLLVRRLVALQDGVRQSGAGARVAPLRPFLLRELQAHIEGHLGRRIRLADLAAMASLSVDHFVRAFAQATGSTPHQWIVQRRLDHACARLCGSSECIGRIARRCGFSSSAHFSTTFRRHYGLTPTAYRQGNAMLR